LYPKSLIDSASLSKTENYIGHKCTIAYERSSSSGTVVLGFPNSGGFGSVKSGTLENSNVDLASELTEMIEAQKSYTANSKVFQTGSELLDVLVNLQR
jgi:flagellar hook protein FlgE